MPDRKRVCWFIILRMVVVSIFLVSTIFWDVHGQDSLGDVLLRLILATYVFSLCSLLILKFYRKKVVTLTYAQIVWDLMLVTMLVLLTGGVNSPYAFLYFLSILSASILHARSEAYYTASLCVILYGAILDLQYYGKLAPLGLSELPALRYGPGYLCYLIFLYSAAFYLTAFLAGHLSERARVSENALQEKAIDYEELERLNSSIVSTIDSGLLTVNVFGRIRVFNSCAETLTGVSQRDAYDRTLTEIFPGFAPYCDSVFGISRGEFTQLGPDGSEMVLAFKTVPLTGKQGERLGAVVDLHDLTEMKRMTEELKRADQLAAVGELSARMAHEIRNPLAAISGSVQLVALSPWADEKDRRLLSIILREADRLDGLLHDFLCYARPMVPVKVPLELRQVMTDLCSLLSKDPRMQRVSVVNEVPPGLLMHFDKDQCEQVFLNLMVNSAEAIEKQGEIRIQAETVSDQVQVRIKDDGQGMKPEDVQKVFQPFFTTKKNGAGLGLATVYRIVESHGGRISVESEEGSGTTITLSVPLL